MWCHYLLQFCRLHLVRWYEILLLPFLLQALREKHVNDDWLQHCHDAHRWSSSSSTSMTLPLTQISSPLPSTCTQPLYGFLTTLFRRNILLLKYVKLFFSSSTGGSVGGTNIKK
jgi:hypothetical protein